MIYYMAIISISIFLGLVYILKLKQNFRRKYNLFYFYLIALILICFSGFRGDFTSDYKNYTYLFNYYNLFSYRELLEQKFGQEIGYVILNLIIGEFSKNPIWIIFVCSAITIILYFRELKKTSVNVWLSIFLFLTIGQYYSSFNLIRQIMSSAIIFSGSRYLYERNYKRYLFIVLIATLIHKTSLIMLIFYYILNIKLDYRKLSLYLILLSFCTNYFLSTIVNFIRVNFYTGYGLNSYGLLGFNYKNIVLQIIIFIFISMNIIKMKYDKKINIWINASFFYTFFSVLGLEVLLIERLSNFFAPYILLLIPKIIDIQNNKKKRVIYIVGVIVFAVLFNYILLSGSGYDPYYFIWEKIKER